MTNNTTKRALISSAVALALCFVMLVGTTFAWFTDEVSSDNNVIKTGTLDVQLFMHDANGDHEITDSSEPLFGKDSSTTANATTSDTLWEPGKTQTVYLSIKNNGTLDLKYKVAIDVTGVTKNLHEVMEYIITPDAQYNNVAKADLDWTQGIAVNEGVNVGAEDVALKVGETHYFALSVHMDEYANNDYQDGSITFNLKVLAGQLASESDSFDNQYDANAGYGAPLASVEGGDAKPVSATRGMGGTAETMNLVTSYVFRTTETKDEAKQSPYRYYHADFVVKANKDIAAGAVGLVGYYEAFCEDYNDGNWVAIVDENQDVPAGTEIRLLELLLNGGSMNYEELCEWVPEFHCGIAKLGNVEAGTTITVELRLYETTKDPALDSGAGNGPANIETGEFITVGVYDYTFN